MTTPADQDARERFVHEHDRNFSVVASAGSGKTRAIVDRIIAIAAGSNARELLPRLVVVTFTNRAADEMQQRARASILESGVGFEVIGAFDRAFFGTIHSFCVRLLRNYGVRLGLPTEFELITDDEEIWNEFVQQQTQIGTTLSPEQRHSLLRHVEVRRLMELGRRGGATAEGTGAKGPCPSPELEKVLSYRDKRSKKVESVQAELREWHEAFVSDDRFLPLLECSTTAREFVALWHAAFSPLREWIRCCSLQVAAEVEQKYREFRNARGVLTYDDQVALARELLRDPATARRVREKQFSVILDEAQDTDPKQFSVLLEITRPVDAGADWLVEQALPPAPGRFCMVGDFQQSIFGDRADLAHYRRVHDALMVSGTCEEVRFSVTFRLDEQQLAFINDSFRAILNNEEGQVEFVELHARPDILPGQVIRFELDPPNLVAPVRGGTISERQKARFEARQLARWIRQTGLERLRARSWREVAILCPRKRWFEPLQEALRDEGFEVQIQSERDIKGDSPAYAWLTALLTVLAKPMLGYEIVGVLREVFGIADHDLALFCEGDGDWFQIAHRTTRTGTIADTLNLLAAVREAVAALPVFSAVEHLIAKTQLRARLAALPVERYGRLGEELDELRTLVATAEAEGQTLAELAETFRTNFVSQREVRGGARDAIQLITAQKAKGSEWDAVIVPFLAREVRTPGAPYPRLIRRGGQEATIALAKEDLSKELTETLSRLQRQEMERLLYVTVTRARHTLVLVSDRPLYENKRGQISARAQFHLLTRDPAGDAAHRLAQLTASAEPCALTGERQQVRTAAKQREREVAPLPVGAPEMLAAGRREAWAFPQKQTPSRIVADVESRADLEAIRELEPLPILPSPENAATRYGEWWHWFVQQLPLGREEKSWDDAFAREVQLSPDPTRSKKEWKLLRAQLCGQTDFARRLRDPQAVRHPELPFLARVTVDRCVEGVIDLAVWSPETQSWFLIDWKTNRVTATGWPDLKVQYEPQITAYRKALQSLTGRPVEAGIYATSIGRWIPY